MVVGLKALIRKEGRNERWIFIDKGKGNEAEQSRGGEALLIRDDVRLPVNGGGDVVEALCQ